MSGRPSFILRPRAGRSVMQAARRGWANRCPACGQVPLFDRWMQPHDDCPACHEGHAYAAISNAVPVLAAPIAIACGCLVGFVTLCFFPLHVLAATLLGEAAALVTVFHILPRAKGLLIGIAWAVRLGSEAEMPDLTRRSATSATSHSAHRSAF